MPYGEGSPALGHVSVTPGISGTVPARAANRQGGVRKFNYGIP